VGHNNNNILLIIIIILLIYKNYTIRGKMTLKKNISISIPSHIADWLKNDIDNASNYISELLEIEYKEKDDPITKIKHYEKERMLIDGLLEKYYLSIQRTVEDGNKIERDQARRLLIEREEKEKAEQEKYINLLEKLRGHPHWEEFVDSYDELGTNEIITYNEEFVESGIDTKGWGNLKRLMNLLTKEQLKGGMISSKGEDAGDVEKSETS